VPLFQNEFDLHENELLGGAHFHMNGFALRLVLTQRQKATRKWPIECIKTDEKVPFVHYSRFNNLSVCVTFQTVTFKSYLLSMGIANPVTR